MPEDLILTSRKSQEEVMAEMEEMDRVIADGRNTFEKPAEEETLADGEQEQSEEVEEAEESVGSGKTTESESDQKESEERSVEGENEKVVGAEPVVDMDWINELAAKALGQPPVSSEAPATTTNDLGLTDEEIADALYSPENLKALLLKVRGNAPTAQQVAALVQQQVVAQEKARLFYDTHKELAPYKDFVRYVALGVEKEHPDWTEAQVLEETATRAKARIPAAKTISSRKPALPSVKGTKSKSVKPKEMSALEKQLSEMPDRF